MENVKAFLFCMLVTVIIDGLDKLFSIVSPNNALRPIAPEGALSLIVAPQAFSRWFKPTEIPHNAREEIEIPLPARFQPNTEQNANLTLTLPLPFIAWLLSKALVSFIGSIKTAENNFNFNNVTTTTDFIVAATLLASMLFSLYSLFPNIPIENNAAALPPPAPPARMAARGLLL